MCIVYIITIIFLFPATLMAVYFTLMMYWQIVDELDRRSVLKTLKAKQQRMSMRKAS